MGPPGVQGATNSLHRYRPHARPVPRKSRRRMMGPPREPPVHLVTLALSAGRGLLGLRRHSSRGLHHPLCRLPGGSSSRGGRRWGQPGERGARKAEGVSRGSLSTCPRRRLLHVASPDVGSGFWGAASRHGLVGNAGQSGVGGGQEAWSACQLLGATALGGSLSGRHIRKNGAWNFLFEKK